jgi:hypothetical protein
MVLQTPDIYRGGEVPSPWCFGYFWVQNTTCILSHTMRAVWALSAVQVHSCTCIEEARVDLHRYTPDGSVGRSMLLVDIPQASSTFALLLRGADGTKPRAQ